MADKVRTGRDRREWEIHTADRSSIRNFLHTWGKLRLLAILFISSFVLFMSLTRRFSFPRGLGTISFNKLSVPDTWKGTWLQVRVNKNGLGEALFSSGLIGSDNAITRHGIHGLYWQFNVEIETSLFNKGDNTIYLTQARNFSALHGVMYDYVRLEAPSLTSNKLAWRGREKEK